MKPRIPSAVLEGLLFSLLIFGPFAFGCVEPWSRAILETLAFLTALACFLRGRETASPLAAAGWAFPAAVALLGCGQVLAAAPADGPRPPWPFTATLHGTESAVLLWAAYACVLYSVPRIVASAEAARRCARLLFGLGVAVALLGFLQAATSADMIYWTRATLRFEPPFGPYYNHDHAANLFLMSLAAGAGLLWARVGRWNSTDGPLPGEMPAAGLTAAGMLLLFSAIVYCNSRGALMALCLAGGAMALAGSGFARGAGRRRVQIAAALGGTAFVVFCAFAYVRAGGAAGAPMEKSVNTRLIIYGDCWRWLRDSPLFGTGLGSFSAVYPSYQDQSVRAAVSHAHSDWIEFLLEMGLFGGLLALGAAAAFLIFGVRCWWRAKSREMRALIGGVLAAVLGFAAHSLFEFSFQIPANAVIFVFLAGALLSASAWADKNERPSHSNPPELGPSLAGVACFAIAAWAAVLPAAASWSAARIDTPSERADRLRVAASRDDDPAFTRDLSREAYRAAVESPEPNPVFLRAAMSYALDAAAMNPFDSASLYLAGASLWRLRRFADADVFLRRERQVGFSPYAPVRQAPADPEKQKLDVLKQLDLLPRKGPAR